MDETTAIQDRLEHALGLAGVGVGQFDLDDAVTSLSNQAAKLLGVSTQFAVGRSLADLLRSDPTSPGVLWPTSSHAPSPVQLITVSTRTRLIVPGDHHDGQLLRLRLSHAAMEAAANAIIITDVGGVIAYVNPAFTQMTGYTSVEAIGQNSRMLKSGSQGKEFYQLLWSTISNGATWNGTFVNRRKDGSTYQEASTITPVMGLLGITHFVNIKRDVTAQRTLEEVVARNERLDLIGQLAASVAHDLANILTPITAGVSFLQSEPLSQELQEVTADMAQSTSRANLMVRQLLDFVRGGQGMRASIKTSQILQTFCTQIGKTLPTTVVFQVRVAPGLPSLVVDSMQLYQVLQNLCINAADAMPTGGELLVDAVTALPAAGGQGSVEIRVKDTGTGIEPQLLQQIFAPFFTTKPPGRGTGIGLPTVKRIVEAHGGSIQVSSELGRGSVFTVCFPVSSGLTLQ